MTGRDVILAARSLRTDDDSNPQYDRALVELTADLLRGSDGALHLLFPDPGSPDLREYVRDAILDGRS